MPAASFSCTTMQIMTFVDRHVANGLQKKSYRWTMVYSVLFFVIAILIRRNDSDGLSPREGAASDTV